MRELAARDLRAVLDAVYDLHAIMDDEEGRDVPPAALARLKRLVPADTISYNGVDPDDRRLVDTELAPGQENLSRRAGFGSMLPEHPAFAAYRAGRFAPGSPVALTDLMDWRRLRELRLYREVYRPAGVADHLLVLAQEQTSRYTLLTIGRSRRGFSARDRAVADLVTAHLVQAVDQRARRRKLAAAARVADRSEHRTSQAAERWEVLTRREREVVDRLVAGDTDREIARVLGVSPRTVHKHLESVYRKLEVGNRTGAIAAYHRHSA